MNKQRSEKTKEAERDASANLIEYQLAKEMADYLKTLIERINITLITLEITKEEIKSSIEYHDKDYKKRTKVKIKGVSHKKLKEAFKDLVEGGKSDIKKLNSDKVELLSLKSKYIAKSTALQKRCEELSNEMWQFDDSIYSNDT
jgi:REP element-mobilizing transposase RayT